MTSHPHSDLVVTTVTANNNALGADTTMGYVPVLPTPSSSFTRRGGWRRHCCFASLGSTGIEEGRMRGVVSVAVVEPRG